MGNVVGTISFDRVQHHRFHKLVMNNMDKYGLEEARFIKGDKTIYAVEISGLKLWWLGGVPAYNTISDFLSETKDSLFKDGATNVETHIDRLPL